MQDICSLGILNSMMAIFFFQSFRFIIVTELFLTCLTLCMRNKTLNFHLTYVQNNMTPDVIILNFFNHL